MIIYMATNKVNGKRYIGQTIGKFERRKKKHISDAKSERDSFYFHSAIRKYGPENLEWQVLSTVRDVIELKNEEELIYQYIHYYPQLLSLQNPSLQ